MVKLLENTFRAVNIGMANELALMCRQMGIDVWEVIDAAKTKPFGFMAFYPGPGLGGHCIPIDPFYLSWVARKHGMPTRFIELAGEINTRMPEYVIEHVIEALNEQGKPVRGSRIAILGMAYKKDVDDPRESPSFELMDLLRARGAVLSYNDPHVPVLPRVRHHDVPLLASQELTPEYLAAGKPVVSTSIRDVVKPYGEQGLVAIADTVPEMVQACEAALREPRGGAQARADAFLRHTSWDATWQRVDALLAEATAFVNPPQPRAATVARGA